MNTDTITRRYRTARRDFHAATTLTARGNAARRTERALAAADAAGITLDIAAIENDYAPQLTARTVYVGRNATGQPVYDTVWA